MDDALQTGGHGAEQGGGAHGEQPSSQTVTMLHRNLQRNYMTLFRYKAELYNKRQKIHMS